MCFSATASFVTAAVTGAIGVVTLSRVAAPRQLPLAAMPIIFAVQQFLEGSLWLTLVTQAGNPFASSSTFLFLILAQVWWPVFVPIAALLIEKDRNRRSLMLPSIVVGAAVATYLLWGILTRDHRAEILDGHIVYMTEEPQPLLIGLAYLAAAALPLILSSQRAVATLGAVVLVGGTTAYFFYWQAFVSVWCFFAAAASGLILFHFERQRTERLSLS
ncbi:MAG: DUF6629 family protein [Devosia sp.]